MWDIFLRKEKEFQKHGQFWESQFSPKSQNLQNNVMLSGAQNDFSSSDGKPEVLFCKVKMDLISSKDFISKPSKEDLIMWFSVL